VDPSLEQPVPAMQRGMPDTHLRHWVEPGTRAYELVGLRGEQEAHMNLKFVRMEG
jgi:hypothetical protein